MSKINIGIEVDVQKLLDTRLLIQAGSGGGKSYALRKVIESIGNQVQQIVIDPEGEFVTLREKFDFALVSKGGDIPLSVRYAETLAQKILETGVSVIIDLYELPQHERILFVKRFLNAVINAPKELWHPCFIHVDEAHIFCPESSQSESTAAVIDLCTRGRKRGYCAVLATQRLPKLNKDATAECNNKMIGRSAQDIDRKRAGEELGMTSKTDVLAIRDLQPGQFFAFGPAISSSVIEFKVSPVITTHLQSGKRMITAPPTPKAIAKILDKLSDIPEEAEKELQTKQQFQKEIARLKTELSKKPVAAIPDNNKQVQQAREETRKHYTAVLKERDGMIVSAQTQIRKLQGILAKICQMSAGEPDSLPAIPALGAVPTTPEKIPGPASPSRPASTGSGSLAKCPRAIMEFLAQYDDREFTKAQVGISIGYSPNSGGFNNSLSELTTRGFILRNGQIRANPEAKKEIAAEIGNPGHREYDIAAYKPKLSKCEGEIYEVLLANPEKAFSKESLASETASQYSANSGGFNNSISSLSTLDIIVRDRGQISLNPDLVELM
jgi:hypothetical protein